MTRYIAEIITLRAIALKRQRFHLLQFSVAEIITLRAIALKRDKPTNTKIFKSQSRDHNATSYSTETSLLKLCISTRMNSRDHNATSYSTETSDYQLVRRGKRPEIITLRAIALKRHIPGVPQSSQIKSRDHNATSYSTETREPSAASRASVLAEIITLRAIALKLATRQEFQ